MKITEPVDLLTQVQRVITTAPRRRAFTAAHEKLSSLQTQRETTTAELTELVKSLDKSGVLDAQARALREGKEIPPNDSVEAVRSVRRKLQILDTAIAQQATEIQALRCNLSREVNTALQAVRQPTIKRVAEALQVLREAHNEEYQIRAEAARGGIDMAFLTDLTVPLGFNPLAVIDEWIRQRTADGFTV
jgi:chromosome segregation ATPase